MRITICGSIAFYKEMQAAKNQLIQLGNEVEMPELEFDITKDLGGGKVIYFDDYVRENGGMESFSDDHIIWSIKGRAMKSHFDKIDWADAILVINHEKEEISGYIGGNTLIEMGTAFYLKKRIYILNLVSSELSYKQEVLGMGPIFLGGDLNMVK